MDQRKIDMENMIYTKTLIRLQIKSIFFKSFFFVVFVNASLCALIVFFSKK